MVIRYCVWDVGKTIYPYSLKPFTDFCIAHSQNVECFQVRKSQNNVYNRLLPKPVMPLFDQFMSGEINTEQFYEKVCVHCHLNFNEEITNGIEKNLRAGIGAVFPKTIKAMIYLKQHNVQNAILSNALPNLAEYTMQVIEHTGFDLVQPDKIFTSYALHALKPNIEAFQKVLNELDAEPQEVMFIDDKKTNVKAARSLGIHGIVHNPKKNIYQQVIHALQNTRQKE